MNTLKVLKNLLSVADQAAPATGQRDFGMCARIAAERAIAALEQRGEIPQAEIDLRAKFRSETLEVDAAKLRLAVELCRQRPAFHPAHVAVDAAILQKLARAVQTLAVKQCNTGLNESDEKRWTKMAEQANTIAGWYGLTATAHGDPRGYVLKLHAPADDSDFPHNTWGGKESGWGVAP